MFNFNCCLHVFLSIVLIEVSFTCKNNLNFLYILYRIIKDNIMVSFWLNNWLWDSFNMLLVESEGIAYSSWRKYVNMQLLLTHTVYTNNSMRADLLIMTRSLWRCSDWLRNAMFIMITGVDRSSKSMQKRKGNIWHTHGKWNMQDKGCAGGYQKYCYISLVVPAIWSTDEWIIR